MSINVQGPSYERRARRSGVFCHDVCASIQRRYDVLGTLGEGAFGAVLCCRDRETGRLVAVKVLKEAQDGGEPLLATLREVSMLRSVDHPNLVKLLAIIRSRSGQTNLVFEHMESDMHSELAHFPGGLPLVPLKALTWQLLRAAAYLHERKIIHRDIKPANILLNGSGLLKLCDFGLARRTAGAFQQFHAGGRCTPYVGTRWYRAPEILVGDQYNTSADVWSIGCTVAEFTTGQPLFEGSSSADQLWRIIRCLGPLPPRQVAVANRNQELWRQLAVNLTHARGKTLRQRLSGLHPLVLQVVEACLRLDPRDRPTAALLLQMPLYNDVPDIIAGSALEQCLRDLSVPPPAQMTPVQMTPVQMTPVQATGCTTVTQAAVAAAPTVTEPGAVGLPPAPPGIPQEPFLVALEADAVAPYVAPSAADIPASREAARGPSCPAPSPASPRTGTPLSTSCPCAAPTRSMLEPNLPPVPQSGVEALLLRSQGGVDGGGEVTAWHAGGCEGRGVGGCGVAKERRWDKPSEQPPEEGGCRQPAERCRLLRESAEPGAGGSSAVQPLERSSRVWGDQSIEPPLGYTRGVAADPWVSPVARPAGGPAAASAGACQAGSEGAQAEALEASAVSPPRNVVQSGSGSPGGGRTQPLASLHRTKSGLALLRRLCSSGVNDEEGQCDSHMAATSYGADPPVLKVAAVVEDAQEQQEECAQPGCGPSHIWATRFRTACGPGDTGELLCDILAATDPCNTLPGHQVNHLFFTFSNDNQLLGVSDSSVHDAGACHSGCASGAAAAAAAARKSCLTDASMKATEAVVARYPAQAATQDLMSYGADAVAAGSCSATTAAADGAITKVHKLSSWLLRFKRAKETFTTMTEGLKLTGDSTGDRNFGSETAGDSAAAVVTAVIGASSGLRNFTGGGGDFAPAVRHLSETSNPSPSPPPTAPPAVAGGSLERSLRAASIDVTPGNHPGPAGPGPGPAIIFPKRSRTDLMGGRGGSRGLAARITLGVRTFLGARSSRDVA